MLKRALLLTICSLVIGACGSKGGDGGGAAPNGQVATTGLDAGCLNTATPTAACNGAMYGQYRQYGFQPYGIQYNQWQTLGYQNYYQYSYSTFRPYSYGGVSTQASFCSCGVGYRPVYTATQGLGCVRERDFSRFYGSAVYFYMDANNQFVLAGMLEANNQNQFYGQYPQGMPRFSYSRFKPFKSRGNTCYQHVAQGCQVGVTPCSSGTSCIAQPNSQMGICATGTGSYQNSSIR